MGIFTGEALFFFFIFFSFKGQGQLGASSWSGRTLPSNTDVRRRSLISYKMVATGGVRRRHLLGPRVWVTQPSQQHHPTFHFQVPLCTMCYQPGCCSSRPYHALRVLHNTSANTTARDMPPYRPPIPGLGLQMIFYPTSTAL